MNTIRTLGGLASRVAGSAVLLAFCLAGTAAPAHANVVWYLQNAHFDDGTVATGSFTFDDFYANVVDVNIAVTAGALPAFVYNLGSINSVFGDQAGITVNAPNSLLILDFTPQLPGTGGGTRNIDLTLSNENDRSTTTRQFDAGQVTTETAPEPSLGWMTALLGCCLGLATPAGASLRARIQAVARR